MPQIRWSCPRCGKGANGSTRPRKDDAVRYCLKCTAETGKLVLRVAPALERKRETAALRTQTKAQTTRERAREVEAKRFTVNVQDVHDVRTLDLRETLNQCLRLPEVRQAISEQDQRQLKRRGWKPKFVVRRSTLQSTRAISGHASPWTGVSIAIGQGPFPREQVELLVLHELLHVIVGDTVDGPRWHGVRFRTTLLRAARELWPGITTQNEGGVYTMHERIWRDARQLNAAKAAAITESAGPS